MTTRHEQQTHMDEIPIRDVIGDGETVEELKCAIQQWADNREAAANFRKASDTIKRLAPKRSETETMTYRVDEYTIEVKPTPGGQERKASVTQPGYRVKVGRLESAPELT